ncbi:hypothetical protein F4823DRAFT_309495 [Ustulina deusta]|nr:hypothetical protein F4823DRAFT_309495 [Ustulina deusta]
MPSLVLRTMRLFRLSVLSFHSSKALLSTLANTQVTRSDIDGTICAASDAGDIGDGENLNAVFYVWFAVDECKVGGSGVERRRILLYCIVSWGGAGGNRCYFIDALHAAFCGLPNPRDLPWTLVCFFVLHGPLMCSQSF